MAAAAPRVRLPAAAVVALLLILAVAPPAAAVAAGPASVPPLVARLHAFSVSLDNEGGQDGGGLMECWGALAALRSCTSEIVLFFVNGESYIGPECCLAIRGATRHCWPAVLASVGFTAQEADVLRGFCDAEAVAGAGPPPAGAPVPVPRGKA